MNKCEFDLSMKLNNPQNKNLASKIAKQIKQHKHFGIEARKKF